MEQSKRVSFFYFFPSLLSWIGCSINYCILYSKGVIFVKIFGCDFLDPSTQELKFLIVDAESEKEAMEKVISELKTLKIPKRYIIEMEELLWHK